jgi:hypothetical protein
MKEHPGYDKYANRVGGVVPTARLEWLCRLVNLYRTHRGATWLPGDWDNVRSELAVAAGIGDSLPEWGGTELTRSGEIVDRPSREETDAILARLHQMVDDAVQHKPLIPTRFRIRQESRWNTDEGRYRPHPQWEDLDRATWDDRVRYTVAHLLTDEGLQVARCPAKLAHEETECGNYFLKNQRQKYCSKTCTAREMARAKRQRDADLSHTHARKKGAKHGRKK